MSKYSTLLLTTFQFQCAPPLCREFELNAVVELAVTDDIKIDESGLITNVSNKVKATVEREGDETVKL